MDDDANFELLHDDAPCQALEGVLDEHLYAFNVEATGLADGRLIGGRVRDGAGALLGGFSGHTWGGVCVLTHLWVAPAQRGRGLGRDLLAQAEAEALRRGCADAIVLTHDFQAPDFYERAGYRRVASIADWPAGHANHVYRKRLGGTPA
jgi:ribosomal protein S18 acetylase RimI-like enzyme